MALEIARVIQAFNVITKPRGAKAYKQKGHFHSCISSRPLRNLEQIRNNILHTRIPPIRKITLQHTPPLIHIDLSIPHIITSLYRPKRPITIVPLHIIHQARQIVIILLRLDTVPFGGPTRLAEPEFREPKRAGVVLALLEEEARGAAHSDALPDGAGFERGDPVGGEGVVVPFIDDFVAEGATVERVGAQEGDVCAGERTAHYDEEVGVGIVDGVRAFDDVVVPRAAGLNDGDFADLVAQTDACHGGVVCGELCHGAEARDPVCGVEEAAV